MKADLYGNDVPRWLRALGCFGIERRAYRQCIRFRWAEFSPSMGLALSLDNAGPDGHGWMLHLRLLLWQAFIYLPFLPRREVKGDMHDSWGFSWNWGREWGNGDSIHLHWGHRFKALHMPWGWDWVRTSYLMVGGVAWVHELRGYGRNNRLGDKPPGHLGTAGGDHWFFASNDLPLWKEVHPYRYVTRSGEVQECNATITISEMEHRWRALRWLPWPRKISRSINVSFDQEMGEGRGSWKGGVVGTGFALLQDETPRECLLRMQEEVKFSR